MKLKSLYFVLANSADEFEAILGNESLTIDSDGWALVAPFGNFPKTRLYREAGQLKEQKFIQTLDNTSADAVLASENSLFGKLKRAVIGLTVWKGHGDLNDHDKTALSNTSEKIKLGVIDQIKKTDRGIEMHFALDNDGADAVADGYKFPSILWRVQHAGMQGDAIIGKPFKILSVALTRTPNISGVDSLANARQTAPVAEPLREQQQQTTEPNMNKLAGWLIAMGATTLGNSATPTEDQVLEAMKTVLTSKTGEVTALGNEKSTLSGKITTLENDKATLTTKVTDLTTSLGNEQTARLADRKRAAEFAVDLAIQRGKLTVAQRDGKIAELNPTTPLANEAFDTAVKNLTGGPAVVKIAGTDTQSGKQASALGNEETALQNEYQEAFKAELIATGQNPAKAHSNIMTLPKYAGLALKLVPKKAA